MAERKHARYRLDSLDELTFFPSDEVIGLDWEQDLPAIRAFYRHWTKDEINPPGEDKQEIGDPVALVRDGEILSFALPFSFRPGETEIGAVATIPRCQNQGLCRRVISALARQILSKGLAATLTTGAENSAMQAAAESIGMKRIN